MCMHVCLYCMYLYYTEVTHFCTLEEKNIHALKGEDRATIIST